MKHGVTKATKLLGRVRDDVPKLSRYSGGLNTREFYAGRLCTFRAANILGGFSCVQKIPSRRRHASACIILFELRSFAFDLSVDDGLGCP